MCAELEKGLGASQPTNQTCQISSTLIGRIVMFQFIYIYKSFFFTMICNNRDALFK